jgi:hypothetical protein
MQQRDVLKNLSKTLQREVKAIYKEGCYASELCKHPRDLNDNAWKMIFGVLLLAWKFGVLRMSAGNSFSHITFLSFKIMSL